MKEQAELCFRYELLDRCIIWLSFYKRSLKGNFQDELSRFPYEKTNPFHIKKILQNVW